MMSNAYGDWIADFRLGIITMLGCHNECPGDVDVKIEESVCVVQCLYEKAEAQAGRVKELEEDLEKLLMVTPEACQKALTEAAILLEGPRMGCEKDSPEGNRYIQISHTLATQMAKKFRALLKEGE